MDLGSVNRSWVGMIIFKRNGADILKWWELINSAYWMVSLNTTNIRKLGKFESVHESKKEKISIYFIQIGKNVIAGKIH